MKKAVESNGCIHVCSCRMLYHFGVERYSEREAVDLDRTGIVCCFFDNRSYLYEHEEPIQITKAPLHMTDYTTDCFKNLAFVDKLTTQKS